MIYAPAGWLSFRAFLSRRAEEAFAAEWAAANSKTSFGGDLSNLPSKVADAIGMIGEDGRAEMEHERLRARAMPRLMRGLMSGEVAAVAVASDGSLSKVDTRVWRTAEVDRLRKGQPLSDGRMVFLGDEAAEPWQTEAAEGDELVGKDEERPDKSTLLTEFHRNDGPIEALRILIRSVQREGPWTRQALDKRAKDEGISFSNHEFDAAWRAAKDAGEIEVWNHRPPKSEKP